MKITADIETLQLSRAAPGNVYVCKWKQLIFEAAEAPKGTTSYREWAIFHVCTTSSGCSRS